MKRKIIQGKHKLFMLFIVKISNFASCKKRIVVEDLVYFKQFDIKLSMLTIGLHEFNFTIDKFFFEKHINDEIIDANVEILLQINKKETMYLLNFTVSGALTLQCDVCLDDMEYLIQTEEELILKTTNENLEKDYDNIDFISPQEQTYNVEQIIYEVLYAQIPMRKTHEENNQTCNQEFINWLLQNEEKEKQTTDPRWDTLKKIKNKI